MGQGNIFIIRLELICIRSEVKSNPVQPKQPPKAPLQLSKILSPPNCDSAHKRANTARPSLTRCRPKRQTPSLPCFKCSCTDREILGRSLNQKGQTESRSCRFQRCEQSRPCSSKRNLCTRMEYGVPPAEVGPVHDQLMV